ncbi:MAG: hypothetical protein JNJ80_02560, partial [Gemmatimonadetes bacterium]|nr:hypothetical protein [Gemmatimonadota bacterium]
MRPYLLVAAALAACAPDTPGGSPAGTPAPPAAPWTLEAVSPDTADGIRILV